MQFRAFVVMALASTLLSAANVGANPTVRIVDTTLAARSACDDADEIDIKFDIGLDGDTFATCKNVNWNTWEASSTPGDFNWCRTEWTRCSGTHRSGVCNRGSKFCEAARQYCAKLGGSFSCN
ncbi:predicted protein [Postia placenta Mad-698-R]|nr:predicted protein [Postia placenta Mad-698-R]